MKRAVLLVVSVLLWALPAQATTYYVRTDGSNTNTGTTNSAGGAWLTIGKCLAAGSTLVAGDICRVQAGTYVETPAVAVSGTSGNTITAVADGTVTLCGMSFSSKSYVRIIGFTMDPHASTCGGSPNPVVAISNTNTGLEFWNDTIGDQAGHGLTTHNAGDTCSKCIVIGGSFHDISGGNNGLTLVGDDTFMGYSAFTTICYIGINPSGSRVRMVNEDFSGMLECGATHPDFYYINNSTLGFATSLIEATFGVGTTTASNNKFAQEQNQSTVAWTNDVHRFNVSYDLGSGAWSVFTTNNAQTGQWYYNNTLVDCQRANNSSSFNNCGGLNVQPDAMSGGMYNNLFYQAWADVVTTGITPWYEQGGPTVTKDYNLAFSPNGSVTFASPWTLQTHPQSNVDPKLTNVSGEDFTLGATSGAKGVGGPLTTAAGSGANSTALTVATGTGSFFIGNNATNLPAYGGNLVPGDFITVGSCTAQVSSVSGDVLTLASPCTWNNADPVYFGSSSTIDIGAYPYKVGGYTLSATYMTSSGTATVTPNDASLVRFLVCYQDGIPTTVVNAAPWTCPTGSGTFEAKVYPRYASLTQGVDATLVASNKARPLRGLVIRSGDWALLGAIPLLPIGWRLRRRKY